MRGEAEVDQGRPATGWRCLVTTKVYGFDPADPDLIVVSDDGVVTMFRLVSRWWCDQCGNRYGVPFEVCSCGAPLQQRDFEVPVDEAEPDG